MSTTLGHFARLGLDEARALYYMGRMTDAQWRLYMILWTWTAARFSGPAGAAQDRFVARCGYPALQRRFARMRRLLARVSFADTGKGSV